jgi:hypothetical protein
VLYSSGGINLQGSVAPNGAVAVSISAGRQYALGEGVLSFNSGSGTWRGQGNAGVCVGTWVASRLG